MQRRTAESNNELVNPRVYLTVVPLDPGDEETGVCLSLVSPGR